MNQNHRMTGEIRVFTLGQLQIQRDGVVLEDFISAKAVLLFVYLAMHPGEHSRKKLAAMLWSETNDEQALKNLRTVLSSLRQNLPNALIVERDGLAINPQSAITVDARQFDQGCEAAFASPNSVEKLHTLEQLAALYQGGFLANVTIREAADYDEWCTEMQRHLHGLYARLLYEIVKLAEDQADYEGGIGYARRLVALDPYWDPARRHLMRMLTYTNRANEALREYEAFVQLLSNELAAEPEPETASLYEQIRTRNIRLPGQRETQSFIALPDMPFVESPDDIALVQRMLNTPQCRLLTIYGITGVGKTMLATQIAFHRQHLYRDGAYLIVVKPAQSARDLAYQIAGMLEIEINSQPNLQELEDAILEHLKDRHLLLVLDNYENLMPETALIERILEEAARVQLLVTSQAPLNLFREWLLPLQGLRVPSPDTPNPEAFEAVRLFELTAQRINPRFSVQGNLADVVEICRLVDGLPLALIIAAGWTQVVPIKKIKEYIIEGQEFNLPVQQGLPPHHQSLDLMLDHTWSALTAGEQYALTAMSIFSTSFGIEEVQQVCALDFEVLMAMIQKALIQKFDEKYRMHPLIWRYARKKLLFSDQREALWERYTSYVIELLTEIQRQRMPLHEYLLAIEYQYAVIWNYDWMPKSAQARYILAVSRFLADYWEITRGEQVGQLCELFEGLLNTDLPPEDRLLVYMQLARFALVADRVEAAYDFLRAGLRENAVNAPFADWSVAFSACIPLAHLMEGGSASLPVSMDADEDSLIRSSVYHKLLALYLNMRDYTAAEGFFNHLMESLEQPFNRALILATWGAVSAESGRYSVAYQHFTDALKQIDGLDQPLLKQNLESLAVRVGAALNHAQ